MAAILDHRGRPVDLRALREEHAAGSITSIRSPYSESVATGLTPRRLGYIMRAANEGDIDAFLTLAEEMEERDLHYRSVVATRKLAPQGRPVDVAALTEDAREVEIADAVREELLQRPEYPDLVGDLLDALAKGYAAVEIVWDLDGKRWAPVAYEWRDPRWFQWDVDSLRELRIRDEREPDGLPLPPFKFLVHTPRLKSGLPLRAGLARLGAIAYMLKAFTVRDWAAFMEVFGMPLRLGRYPVGASAEDRAELLRAVANIGVDTASIVSSATEVQFVESSRATGGDKLFSGAADWWDSQVSKAILGQTMTADNGSSLSQAKVHNEVRLDILKADARQLDATINRDLVRAWVDLNFGPQRHYPRITTDVAEPEDQESKARVYQILAKMGVPIEASWIRDQFGVPEPEPDAATVGSAPAPAPPSQPPTPPPPRRTQRNTATGTPTALNAAGGAAAAADHDEIDRLTGEALEDWEPLVQGSLGELLGTARNASSYEDLVTALDEAERSGRLDVTDLTEALAGYMLRARGLGDATDEV